jgi:hypothetical protein
MSETKPGDIARKAKKAETASAPASLDTMLCLPASVTIGDRQLKVFPVTLGRMKVFGEAQARLGELALLALVEGKPELLGRLNAMLGRTEGAEQMDLGGVESSLRFMLLQPTPEQVDAMLDIAESVLNGKGQTVARDELEDTLTPPLFIGVYRMAVNLSGLNP